MKILLAVIAALSAWPVHGSTYVSPVATARVKDRLFSTTTAFRNDGQRDVSCEATYSGPKIGGSEPLRARYDIPARKTVTEEDTLMEVGAVGTMRFVCSDEIVIATRIQTSSDEGATFDVGRVFPAARDANTPTGKTFEVRTSTDLLVMEVAGKIGNFDVLVKSSAGNVLAETRYALPPFGQQILNLSKVLKHSSDVHVQIRLAANADGRVVIAKPTSDAALLKLAQRMSPESRARFNTHRAEPAKTPAANDPISSPSVTQQLLVSSFKAAPFRDPFTGLVFMRDRWYDPSTGTFLTPDPEGYDDSSNPYIFGKGDPVNNYDPTGRHTQVQRRVGGIDFTLYAPTPDELAKGQLGMHGTYVDPLTGRRESFSWDQHVSEMFLMQARWNPTLASSFEGFFGVAAEAIPLSTPRLYWNGLREHKEDIALSTVLSLTMLAPAPARGAAPRPPVLVPGGGLLAHEQAGGHTIAKHVGQSRAQLEARLLAERNIASASTFATPATAEQVVADAIAANQPQIQTWLRGSASRLRVNYTASRTTGFTLRRGVADMLPVQGARIILVRDPAMPTGYRILTSFPQ